MRFSITCQGNNSPLMTILDLRDGPAFFLRREKVSLVRGAETSVAQIYFLYHIFWQGGAVILFVPFGITIPFITQVASCKGA